MDWIAPREADYIINPIKSDFNDIKSTEQTFNTLCAVCHGAGGNGDGIAGMGLIPKPANLVSKQVQIQTDGAIYWKLTYGRPPMAPYKDALSENQRWELVNFIRHLAENK